MALAMNDDSLVVDFHLGGTALTDEGLAHVKALPKVVQLDLKDTQITDAGLANLAGIATLNRLHLEKTKVTDAGLAHLKDLGEPRVFESLWHGGHRRRPGALEGAEEPEKALRLAIASDRRRHRQAERSAARR